MHGEIAHKVDACRLRVSDISDIIDMSWFLGKIDPLGLVVTG